MEDNRFEQVQAAFAAAGVYYENGNFRTRNMITGRRQAANVQAVSDILVGAGMTVNEYVAALQSRRLSGDPTLADGTEGLVTTANNYSKVKFIHPGIDSMSPWSAADKEVFARFGFAEDPVDGKLSLIIDNGDGTMAVVHGLTVTEVASRCSAARPMNSVYRNLYEELTVGFNNRMNEVVDAWRTGRLDDAQEGFVRALGMRVPHCMLKRLDLSLTVEKVNVQVDTPEGPKTVTTTIPRAAQLTMPGKHDIVSPIEFLVKYTGDVAARPEMHRSMPKVFTNDPKEPAMRCLDLENICEEGECPTWDKYLSRYTPDEGDAIKAYIWSILDAGNRGRQMLYIYDSPGYSAKSAMINCIIECLGDSMCASIQKDSLNNQFSLAKVWDKRLVTYADNKNPKLLMSEKMHMMTGGDYADIEMKGRNSFHARLQTKIIASGNIPLEIHPDARHEVTRAIVVKPRVTDEMLKEFCALDENGNVRRRPDGSPVFLGDPTFEKRLKEEFHRFLTRCREAYSRLCPTRGDIVIPDSMYAELLSNAPTETFMMADFFDTYFEYRQGSKIAVRDFNNALSAKVDLYGDFRFNKDIDLDTFKEYVTKRFPDVRFGVCSRIDGRVCKVVEGLALKEAVD